jgi:ribosomal protein L37E
MLSAGATVALLAATVALLVWGMRGRRVDDHPLCRRCGFDLFGKPASSLVCSECGADLRDVEAIRRGNRVRRPVAIYLALPLLLTWGALLGGFGWVGVRGVDANWYLPTWWLISELGSKPGVVRDGALAELDRRLLAGKLSAGQVGQIAGRALALQADPDRPWSTNWGDFVENARDMSVLPDELWQQYVRQIVADGLTVQTRPVLRRGDALPTAFQITIGRCGKTYAFNIGGTLTVAIGGATSAPQNLPDADTSTGRGGPGSTYQVPFDTASLKGVADGSQPVRVTAALAITPTPLSSLAMTGQVTSGLPAATPTIVPIDVSLSADAQPITLLAADHSSVNLVADAARRSQVLQAVSADIYPGANGMVLEVRAQQPPVNLEMDVFLRNDAAEQKVGHLIIQANGSEAESFFVGRIATPCEMVLRPMLREAITTIDATGNYWGDQIVMKDVQLTTGPVGTK